MTGSKPGVSAETMAAFSTPDTVESRLGTLQFDDGAPSEATAALLYDHLDFLHGVQAFSARCRARRWPRSAAGSCRSGPRTTRSCCSRS